MLCHSVCLRVRAYDRLFVSACVRTIVPWNGISMQYVIGVYISLKAGLHYATPLQATKRLRKVKAERCCLQRCCLQHLLHVYTMQHGCSDYTLICLQPTVWHHSYIAMDALHLGEGVGNQFLRPEYK